MASKITSSSHRPPRAGGMGLRCPSMRATAWTAPGITWIGCIASIALFSSSANATHITGTLDGDPHEATHIGPPGRSTLDPDPVIEMHAGECPWLLPALAKLGMDADGTDNAPGGGDDWTITFNSNLTEDSLSVDLYKAYVDTAPGYSCGAGANKFTLAARTIHHTGGAAICLTYQPHEGDPTDIHWIQVVRTNFLPPPAVIPAGDIDSTTFAPFHVFIDDGLAGQAPGAPFYDTIGAANKGAFADRPRDALMPGIEDFDFQVFVATGDLPHNTLTIYDGAWWGFQLTVPGASTFGLLIVGLLGLVGHGRVTGAKRRRARAFRGGSPRPDPSCSGPGPLRVRRLD